MPEQGQAVYTFFLVHAGPDTATARSQRNLLHPSVPVFLDAEDLTPGDDWTTELPRRQRQSLATVALLSASTDSAYYLREEIASAIAYQRNDPGTHRLIPVYLDGLPGDPARIPYGIRQLHALDAVRLGGMEAVADELRKTAQALSRTALPSLPSETPVPGERVAVFEALCRLLDSQFEEVVFRVEAPRAHLSPASEPLARRALDLVQWAEHGGPARMNRLREGIQQVNEPDVPPPGAVKWNRKRVLFIALAALGLIALGLGTKRLLNPEEAPPTPAPTTVSTTLPPSPPAPVDPQHVVRGTIQVPPQNSTADLTVFAIEVDFADQTEVVSPDPSGAFRASRIQEGPEARLTWSLPQGQAHGVEVVLWPLMHPAQARSPYDSFSVTKLTDVVDNEKNAILRDLRNGRHGLDSRAQRKADGLRELFKALESVADVRVAGLPVSKREFKLWQDVCHTASEFRATRGRSRITDDQIEFERQWRRYQITVAGTRRPDRDLVRSLNGWALFSREAYSRSMGAWPERPLALDMIEDPRWLTAARDDVELILRKLPQLRPFLERSRVLQGLGRDDRALYDRLSSEGDEGATAGPEGVAMSHPVHLLAALNAAVGPGESP